jgi:hypothetical protein
MDEVELITLDQSRQKLVSGSGIGFTQIAFFQVDALNQSTPQRQKDIFTHTLCRFVLIEKGINTNVRSEGLVEPILPE